MADEHDIEAHLNTWTGFTRLLVTCMVGIVIALALMAAFLV